MGLTQERFGEMLGVSNQAVSKWESGAALPDVMLLPRIAEIFGITIDELYRDCTDKGDLNCRINAFPEFLQNFAKSEMYRQFFRDSENLNYLTKITEKDGKARIPDDITVGVISYTGDGAAFISDDVTLAAKDVSGDVFDRHEVFSALKMLCDSNVRQVLGYLFSEAFSDIPAHENEIEDYIVSGRLFDFEFALPHIIKGCSITEDTAVDVVYKLMSLHLVEISNDPGPTKYVFMKTKAVEAAVLLQAAEKFVRTSVGFGCGYLVGHTRL